MYCGMWGISIIKYIKYNFYEKFKSIYVYMLLELSSATYRSATERSPDKGDKRFSKFAEAYFKRARDEEKEITKIKDIKQNLVAKLHALLDCSI